MLHLPAPENKRLVWYLAMEEYIGQQIQSFPEGVFFTWVVKPTVIFGRHQVMEQEVNLDFCKTHNISTYRRKSGGGCVYADSGNLMLSYVVHSTHSEQVFQEYLTKIAKILSDLGLNAVKTEHNDILVDGKKVSGNACYALKTGTIVHGTMLFDVDFQVLQQAITPTEQKLQKHGVKSVRQRVINLRPLLQDFSDIHQLSDCFCSKICTETRQLTEADIAIIDNIEQEYLNPNFIHNK